MIRTVVCLSVLALAPTTAEAETWVSVASQGGVNYEYDSSSIRRSGSNVTVATRDVYTPPVPYSTPGGQVVGNIAIGLETIVIDCGARTYTDQGYTVHAADGTVIYSAGLQPTRPIEAETSTQLIANAVCG